MCLSRPNLILFFLTTVTNSLREPNIAAGRGRQASRTVRLPSMLYTPSAGLGPHPKFTIFMDPPDSFVARRRASTWLELSVRLLDRATARLVDVLTVVLHHFVESVQLLRPFLALDHAKRCEIS